MTCGDIWNADEAYLCWILDAIYFALLFGLGGDADAASKTLIGLAHCGGQRVKYLIAVSVICYMHNKVVQYMLDYVHHSNLSICRSHFPRTLIIVVTMTLNQYLLKML